MTATSTTFRSTIPADVLARVRSSHRDASGNAVEPMPANGGEPLRRCFRNSRPGEALILFGYEPPIGNSPYREIGAVFAHAEPCGQPAANGGYPDGPRGCRSPTDVSETGAYAGGGGGAVGVSVAVGVATGVASPQCPGPVTPLL
jgi:hypothetical protein